MNRLVDIVIPIYNGEQYVSGLIDCLNKQTVKDFCAVIVDDGSKDRTWELLNEQLKDASFSYELIHQENKGLPGARNTGIRNTKAEWVAFMDSDDGLDPHFVEYLYRGVTEKETNLGYCQYQTVAEESQIVPVHSFSVSEQTAVDCMKGYYTRWFGCWVLILRRKWLSESGLLFDEDCTYLEDVPFITQAIALADRIAVIEAPLYYYYIRQGSLMNTPKIEKYAVALKGFHEMAQKLEQCENEAAGAFRSMGHARYYLATLRKGATLMPYKKFRELCDIVPMSRVRHQIGNLHKSQALACWAYLYWKWLFYKLMRILNKM